MKVVIDATAAGVSLVEPDDTDHLSVVLRDTTPEQAAVLLGELGRIDGDHAWLNITGLRDLRALPRGCSWDERFIKAMAYAREHGWTDESGDYVRAHIESLQDQI